MGRSALKERRKTKHEAMVQRPKSDGGYCRAIQHVLTFTLPLSEAFQGRLRLEIRYITMLLENSGALRFQVEAGYLLLTFPSLLAEG